VAGFSATAGGEQLNGFAQVPLRSAGAPIDHNPSLTAVLVNGAELPADGSGDLAAGAKVCLQPVPASDTKEDTGNGLEALNFSFFARTETSLRSAPQTKRPPARLLIRRSTIRRQAPPAESNSGW